MKTKLLTIINLMLTVANLHAASTVQFRAASHEVNELDGYFNVVIDWKVAFMGRASVLID